MSEGLGLGGREERVASPRAQSLRTLAGLSCPVALPPPSPQAEASQGFNKKRSRAGCTRFLYSRHEASSHVASLLSLFPLPPSFRPSVPHSLSLFLLPPLFLLHLPALLLTMGTTSWNFFKALFKNVYLDLLIVSVSVSLCIMWLRRRWIPCNWS